MIRHLAISKTCMSDWLWPIRKVTTSLCQNWTCGSLPICPSLQTETYFLHSVRSKPALPTADLSMLPGCKGVCSQSDQRRRQKSFRHLAPKLHQGHKNRPSRAGSFPNPFHSVMSDSSRDLENTSEQSAVSGFTCPTNGVRKA